MELLHRVPRRRRWTAPVYCTVLAKFPALTKTFLTGSVVLLLSTTSLAQSGEEWRDWPLGDPFTISLEAFFPNIDTTVRLDASDGGVGTTIDFEQNLGMPDTETLPALGFAWRFAKKHRLVFGYFDLSRSGSAISTSEIRFGDEVFQVDLPISSYFDSQVFNVGYSYSLIFDEKKELALAAGLSIQDIQFGLIGTGNLGIVEEVSGLTAPLPAFGLSGGYAFTEKWNGRATLGLFYFDLAVSDEKDISGEIVNAAIAIHHKTFENVQFGLKYSFFDVHVDFVNSRRINSIDYEYHGPVLSFDFVF